MTYLLTLDHKAFKVDPDATYKIYNEDQNSLHYYHVSYITNKVCTSISPRFYYGRERDSNGDPQTLTDYDTDYDAEFECVEWLKDFLITLSKNPVLIELCDNEIFTY